MSEPVTSHSWLARLFRASLRLYPQGLRARYGVDMVRDFSAFEQRATQRRLGRAQLAMRLLGDAMTGSVRAHYWEWSHTRRLAIRRPFGKESSVMTTLPHDVLVAVRRLRQNPGFTLVAALTLALGIGANTAIFSVVYGVLMRPIGVADADGLAVLNLHRVGAPGDAMGMWPAHLDDLRPRVEGRDGVRTLTSYIFDSVTLGGDVEPEELGTSLMVDGTFFPALGVKPVLGRVLGPNDIIANQRGEVCVISEALWQGRFGGAADIVGRVLTLDDTPVTVVGVMPANVPLPQAGVQLWMPQGWDIEDGRLFGRLGVLARLEPATDLMRTSTLMADAATGLVERYPRLEGYTIGVRGFRDSLVGNARPAILAAAGAVGLILLIACANMASLLLSRAVMREREIATRRALGAQRHQLTSQLLAESVLLSGLGGICGVVLALALHRVLLGLAAGLLPRLYDVRLDLPVLGFAAAVSLVAGLIFGLAPVTFAFTRDLAGAMRGALSGRSARARGRGFTGVRQLLVIAQVAVAVVLVVAAALLLRSLTELRGVASGFDAAGVGGARIYLDASAYPEDAEQVAYFRGLIERLEAAPGIAAAGASSGLPMDPLTIDYDLPYTLPGETAEDSLRQAHFRTVTPGYLDALGVPLRQGRMLTTTDRADTESVALINETFAQVAWGDRDPVGQHFSIYGGRRQLSVIGVVADVRFHGPGEATRPAFFVPHTQTTYGSMTVIARGHDGSVVAASVASAALDMDHRQPVHSTFSLSMLEHGAVATERFFSGLLTAFAAIALLLSGAGIYGVIAYWVNESRREIGLRLAVGATSRHIMALVLRRSLTTTGLGLVLGLATAAIGARRLEPYLFGVTATDLKALSAVVALLVGAALVASLVPAMRAARIDPMRSLRTE